MKDTLVVAFGRMNPPTIGHQKLLDAMAKHASTNNADMFFAVSKTQDKKKNPLEYKEKVAIIKELFPKYKSHIVDSSDIKTPVDLLKHYDGKYKNIVFVAGSDRVAAYEELFVKYNGKDYNFETIKVVSAGERDPDADGAEGMSASKLRTLAAEGNYEEFKKGVSTEKSAKKLYAMVRKGMMLGESLISFKLFRSLFD